MEEALGGTDNLSYAKLVSDSGSPSDLSLRTETPNTPAHLACLGKKRIWLILHIAFLTVEVIVAVAVIGVVLATSKCSPAKDPVCEGEPNDKSVASAERTRAYEDMVLHHDIQGLVDKWTEDAVFIYRNRTDHTLVDVHVGNHDGLKKTFEHWFDAGHIARSKVTTLHSGLVGDGIPYVIQDIESFDKDGNSISLITQMYVFKQVGCEFKTHMVVDL